MATPLLDTIQTPADVQALASTQLPQLAEEIRSRMIESVSHTGGHLAPSLGTVELTIALCRIFNFPQDKLIWDVGHQAYAWKMLTGRNAKFDTLRQTNGLRGFPSPEESPYDAFLGGHAGIALSVALGMAAARDARHGSENVVAVVGDGALTNGISLEALNAIRHTTSRLILIINDNGMSISRNVGAFSRALARHLVNLRYNRLRAAAEAAGHRLRLSRMRAVYHWLKRMLKPLLLRQRSAIFEDLGVRYLGPIDGHNIKELTEALRSAEEGHVPVVLHIATVKGKGYQPAELHPSQWHGVAPWDNAKGTQDARPTWSDAFGAALSKLAAEDESVVAITAAMRDGTGLKSFFQNYPRRAYDVGICEEHAVAFAAGLAASGKKPVVALYSTFAQRSVDDVFHELCLSHLPVVLALDRAGFVGADGPTHHGLYDLALLRAFPGIELLAPADGPELVAMLAYALKRSGPTAIRYPRGRVPESFTPAQPILSGKAQILRPSEGNGVIWALGDSVARAQPWAEMLHLGLVNARFVKPLDEACLATYANEPVITLENASIVGGLGTAVAELHRGKLLSLAWPDKIIAQGSSADIMAREALDDESCLKRIKEFIHG